MGLNKEQLAAVEYLEGPLLVLAGPGTGKTQLLSAKVAHILETTDANPNNILCLTFTEAGAENMRTRLQTMIGKEAMDVNIHTYHAFGSNILERYKHYAETFDRKLETPIDETLQFKFIHDIQRGLPAMDILKDADTKDLVSTISNAKAARLSAADLQKIAEQNLQDSRDLSAEISPILLSLKPRTKFAEAVATTYQPILEILLRYSSPEPIVGNVERLANVLAKELNQIIEELSAEEKPKIKRLSDWKTKTFEVYNASPDHKTILKAYRLSDHIANKKLCSLANIMDKYDRRLSEAGLFDFSDMIECAINFLKQDSGFRMQLSELFQYVLLDEFQDTNTSQFELIKLLTDYEKPVVMAVGDDDQAIFEFQGANYSNLRDFQEYYNAKVITLVDNYRSTGEILEVSRHLAAQISDSFAKNYEINKTLRSMRDLSSQNQTSTPQVYRHEFPSSEAEYFWIANEIRKLVDGGASPNDIAVIAPKHKNIVPILPYLKAQHLDVTYEKRDNLLADANISMLIELAQFIWQLAQRKQPVDQLLKILSFDFWELSPVKVLESVQQKWGTSKTVVEYLGDDPELQPIAQFFAALATKAETTPLELWFDYLIGTVPISDDYTSPFLAYYQCHATEAELLEFYENLATLKQKTLAHMQSLQRANDTFLKLEHFITTIEDYQFAGTEIMRIDTYRDGNQSVQLMTSHKSKGLEFKHVFLTSVDDAAWGKAMGNNNKLVLPKNLTYIRHTGTTDDEKLRLFFVAITRAKDSLTMTSSRTKADGSEIRRLRYLSESSREDTVQCSPFLRENAQEIIMHGDELTNPQKIETLRSHWISAYQKFTPDTMTMLKDRMQDYRLTASDLTSFIDIVYAGPQQVYQTKVLRAPREAANLSICYGNLIHKVFEQITNQGIDDDAALQLCQEEAKVAALEDSDRQELLAKGEYSLRTTLQEFRDILRHPGAKAELNLSSERISYDGVPLTGKIDHLEIDPKAKTIEVYDFKTGKHYDKKWDSQPSLYKYSLQLGFYKLLLNLSREYRDFQVTRGHILFVTPDNDGRVYDEVYEFNDKDEAKLKALVKAVYYQMTSLDFVHDETIFVEPDKSNNMTKIKAFIDALIEKSSTLS